MDLLKEPTAKALRKMSVPVSLGMLSTILFQVVDTYFVGTLGPRALAALGFASTVYFLLVGLLIGLSVATSIVLGKALGEQNTTLVRRISSLTLGISFTVTAAISAVGLVTLDPLFGLLGASEAVMADIKAYMIPMYLGMPVLALGIVGGGILRTNGNVRAPEIIFGVAGIINAVLDYLFIFGKLGFPALGIQGVAFGTIISWGFIMLLIIPMLFQKKLVGKVLGAGIANRPLVANFFTLGLPTIVTQLVGPFTLMFITFLLGRQGGNAVAAFGVAGRIETLLMIGTMAVSTALTPFIAQNLGAKQVTRIDEAIVFGGKAATYLGLLILGILFLFIRLIAGLFSNEVAIIDYTSFYFYLVSGSYVFYGLYLVTAAIFNGLQLPQKAMRIVLVKSFAFTFPLAFAGAYFGVNGLFVALAVSNVLGGLYARYEMRKDLKEVGSALVKRNPIQDMLGDVKRLFTTA